MKRFFDSLIYGYWLRHKIPNAVFVHLMDVIMPRLLGLFDREVKPENRKIARKIPGFSDVYMYGWLFGALALMLSFSIVAIIYDLTGYSSFVAIVGLWAVIHGLFWYYTRNTTYESLMADFEGSSKAMKRWYMIQEVLLWVVPITVVIIHLKFFVR